MNISDYFENTKGRGILATSDADGKVNAAVFSRPHVIDEQTVAFIMLDRLTHHNLQSNAHAAYLFMEKDDKYIGKRLYLTKVKEERNSELIEQLRRKSFAELKGKDEYLVYFRVDKVYSASLDFIPFCFRPALIQRTA